MSNITRQQIIESLMAESPEHPPEPDEICYADLMAVGRTEYQAGEIMKKRVTDKLFTKRIYRGRAYFKPTTLWYEQQKSSVQ